MHSRMTLLASEGLASQTCCVFLGECLAGTRDWLAPSLSNDTESIFRWHSNNDAAFRIPLFVSTLHQYHANNKVNNMKQTPPLLHTLIAVAVFLHA